MKSKSIAIACLLVLTGACATNPLVSPPILHSVLETNRPVADIERDTNRKPLETIQFAQVKSGMQIVDYVPGSGYFTRILSNAVGENGKVYSLTPQLFIDKFAKGVIPTIASESGHGNTIGLASGAEDLNIPQNIDMFFTAQNYHDVRIYLGDNTTQNLNNSVFKALKKGGYYVILDHSAKSGANEAQIKDLHRIDEVLVIKEVEAAGFKLDGTSRILANANDDRSKNVFDPAIRGKTDQFILRFKKP